MLPQQPGWPTPFEPPPFASEEVHVWRTALDVSDEDLARVAAVLSADERARADRFRVAPARRQFVAARAALRGVLATYLGCAPADVAFRLGPQGKPALTVPGTALHFNLSHSHGVALVAVTRRGEVGVDVEQVRPLTDADALAERYFAPAEVATLRALPEGERMEGFFNAWTRKEAFLKATGKGISYGVERVEVTLRPGELARVLALDGDSEAARGWGLTALTPAPGYVGALAIPGAVPPVRCWDWPPDGPWVIV